MVQQLCIGDVTSLQYKAGAKMQVQQGQQAARPEPTLNPTQQLHEVSDLEKHLVCYQRALGLSPSLLLVRKSSPAYLPLNAKAPACSSLTSLGGL